VRTAVEIEQKACDKYKTEDFASARARWGSVTVMVIVTINTMMMIMMMMMGVVLMIKW
jgi:hypothetical protein